MKKIFICALFLSSSFVYAQEDQFDEMSTSLVKINGIIVDWYTSFIEFPEVHNNTVKIYPKIANIAQVLTESDDMKQSLSSGLLSTPKAQKYFNEVNKLKILSETLEELIKPFVGKPSGGLSREKMEVILNPLFNEMGWKIKKLDILCKDLVFYEYHFKGCNIMFVHNPTYNNIEVQILYNSGVCSNLKFWIGGGRYKIIQFQDDLNNNYCKNFNATSKKDD